jgi:hypothetical protein
MHQGEQAYGPQSPTQTHGRPHHSPTTAPVPVHHPSYPPHPHPHHHHRPPHSPSTTELPPLSTALYSRDSAASKYYDPTSDHGERALGRDTARYDTQHTPQVRTLLHSSIPIHIPCPLSVVVPTLFICRDAELTLDFSRVGIHTPTQTLAQHIAPTRSPITRPSRLHTCINRRCSAPIHSTNTRARWRLCLTRLSHRPCTSGGLFNRHKRIMREDHQ